MSSSGWTSLLPGARLSILFGKLAVSVVVEEVESSLISDKAAGKSGLGCWVELFIEELKEKQRQK